MSVQGLYQSVQRSLRVRQEQGRQVQTEWDLRLKTVSFEGDELEPVIRKTELSRRSNRIMDPAAHIAPPVMELAQSGRFDLAESFLASWVEYSQSVHSKPQQELQPWLTKKMLFSNCNFSHRV